MWVLFGLACAPIEPDTADTSSQNEECLDVGIGLDVASLGTCERSLATQPRTPQTTQLNGIIVHDDVYIATRGDVALHGTLHLPERTTETGALVVVHGGGWLDCDNRREQMAYYAQGVAEVLNIPTFRIDYRLVQEGGEYPNNLMDVKCGVQWLRQHAGEYGIDPERIGIMGTSAGAHLATMVALTEDRTDLDPQCGDIHPEVSLTLAYSGPSDLPDFVDGPSVARDAPLFYTQEACTLPVGDCGVGIDCSDCVDASPIAHACQADEDPIVLFQAPDPMDEFVPEAQARSLADALDAAGADVQLVIPTVEQMTAAGCPAGSASHGADLCMLNATGDVLNSAASEFLGPR